jgi:orotidine-5'-phosphate decarboxylase
MEDGNQLAKRIMIALDYPTAAEAEHLLLQLAGIPCTMKVGMQLYYAAGPSFVMELKERGYFVFLDLKLHDIPNTVRGAAESITHLGVDMFNVHAAGGVKMMQAALEGVEEAYLKMTQASPRGLTLGTSEASRPIVIGVTQLTSTDQRMMNEEIGIAGSVSSSVAHYAKQCQTAGLHGVVASAQEVKMIKETCGSSFITVTPGIRLADDAGGDQQRVMTPQQAIAVGTNYMVIGRPITQATDPRAKLESIIASLHS